MVPTLREEHRLMVSENRMLRRILDLRMREVTVRWRKLYNEKLHSLYYSSPFMEPEDSLPCSQQPATAAYPEPDEPSLHHFTLYR
jgi:hypothetical protein